MENKDQDLPKMHIPKTPASIENHLLHRNIRNSNSFSWSNL